MGEREAEGWGMGRARSGGMGIRGPRRAVGIRGPRRDPWPAQGSGDPWPAQGILPEEVEGWPAQGIPHQA